MDIDKNQTSNDSPDQNAQPEHTPQGTVFQDHQAPKRPHRKILALVAVSCLLFFVSISGFATYLYLQKAENIEKEQLSFLKPEDAVRAYTQQMIAKAKELKDGGDNASITKELSAIIDERQQVLLDLLHEDTAKFLQVVEPQGFAKDLPSSVAGKTEKSAKVSGKLSVAVGDPIDGITGKNPNAEALYHYSVVDRSGKSTRIYFDKKIDEKFYNQEVTVEAINISGELGAQTDSLTTQSTTAPLVTTTNKRIAVILMNFKSNTTQPFNKSSVVNNYSSAVGGYYNENTYGGMTITADAFGWYTIDADTAACNYGAWGELAKAQAVAAGVNVDSYDHVSYAFPSISSCYWAGMGQINGKVTWINGYGNHMLTVGHELGHNFGLHHAGTMDCTENGKVVAMSDTCGFSEYNDTFDIMGNSQLVRQTAAVRKAFQKAIPAANIVTTTNGDYTIAPLEKSAATTQLVRIPRDIDSTGKVLNYYYIDFRQPFGFDNFASTDNIVNGVGIRVAGEFTSTTKTQLVDTTPGSINYARDSALTAGNEFYDSKRNIRIVTKSVSSSGATISINGATGATCVRNPASITASPMSQWGNAGSVLTYTLTIKSNDSASCSPAVMYTRQTNVTNFTQKFTPYMLELGPGQSTTVTAQITSAQATPAGTYTLNLGIDSSGMTSTAPVGYNIYDAAARPVTVNITSPPNGSTLTSLSGRPSVNATASSANGIKKMEVYMNSNLVSSSATGSISYAINLKKLRISGQFPITVMAYDTQNNVGTATVQVTK